MTPQLRRLCRAAGFIAGVTFAPPAFAQHPDTLPVDTLAPVTVTVSRTDVPLGRLPLAATTVAGRDIHAARPTWGLDEALAGVPGVLVANRYNFSLDQRIAIRGFGSRSAFAVRGVKVLLDGIPQTLPDGQGQLTNLELGAADRIEVLRGAASALFGNASGGVISIWTAPALPAGWREELRVTAGTFDRGLDRTWTKWISTTHVRLGPAATARVTASRLAYEGERDHSAADLRHLSARAWAPLGAGWSLAAVVAAADQPRADNPGALTLAELHADRAAAAPANVTRRAGKAVRQGQAGATLRRTLAGGGAAALTLFGLARGLENPLAFAYIELDRVAYGARAVLTHRRATGERTHHLTWGIDLQRQRDSRLNFGNDAGRPDTVRSLDQLEHVSEVGPFAQLVVEPAPFVTVTAGLRYDRVAFRVADHLVTPTNPDDSGERVMDAVSGAVGVAVSEGDRLTLYANVGSAFETPTTTELANRPDAVGGFNADLGPQRATSYEIGVRGAEPGRAWSVTLFRVDVRDLITGFEHPAAPQRRFFRNAGRARHRGAELAVAAALGPGVTAQGSWTYSDFFYVSHRVSAGGRTHDLSGRPLPGLPRHSVRLQLTARPPGWRGAWVEIERLHASATLVDDTLSTRTTPWAVTHLRAGWEGRVGRVHARPYVALQNAFNRAYVGSVVVNAAAGRYYEPAPGRNIYVGVSVEMER